MIEFSSKPIKPIKKITLKDPDYAGIGAFIVYFIILGVFVPVITSMFFKDKDLINNFIIVAVICLILIVIQNLRKYLKYGKNVKINLENQKEFEILMAEYRNNMIEYDRKEEPYRQFMLERNRKISLEVERQNKFTVITPEEEIKVRYQKSIENLKTNPNRNYRDVTSINKKNNHIEIEITNTIRNYSGICAVLAIQPIPFADIFILTPTQILMGEKIASIRGYEIKENTIKSILKEISSIIGMGIIAQQLLIGAYKTFLPFLGGITTIPAVYGLTYGIGKTMDYYIVAKINGNKINKSEIEKIFKSSQEIGEREGKSQEKEIQAKAKK
jgi:uncharacterized protein (DUF697 family)